MRDTRRSGFAGLGNLRGDIAPEVVAAQLWIGSRFTPDGPPGTVDQEMATLETALQNLEAYPRWMVALGAIVVAALVVWLFTKVLKWTLYLAALVVFGVVMVFVVTWWLG